MASDDNHNDPVFVHLTCQGVKSIAEKDIDTLIQSASASASARYTSQTSISHEYVHMQVQVRLNSFAFALHFAPFIGTDSVCGISAPVVASSTGIISR